MQFYASRERERERRNASEWRVNRFYTLRYSHIARFAAPVRFQSSFTTGRTRPRLCVIPRVKYYCARNSLICKNWRHSPLFLTMGNWFLDGGSASRIYCIYIYTWCTPRRAGSFYSNNLRSRRSSRGERLGRRVYRLNRSDTRRINGRYPNEDATRLVVPPKSEIRHRRQRSVRVKLYRDDIGAACQKPRNSISC